MRAGLWHYAGSAVRPDCGTMGAAQAFGTVFVMQTLNIKEQEKEEISENNVQKKDSDDLTEGVIWKKLLLFFLPIAAGTLFQQLYNAVDAIIVGRFVGTEALAAVGGSASTITNLIITFFVALSSGAAVVIAQKFGAKNEDATKKGIATSVVFFFIIGIALTIIMFFCAGPALRLLKAPEDTLYSAVIYVQIYFAGSIFMLMFNIGSGILRALGNSKTPFWCLMASAAANIVLDLVFVVVFKWGVAGVAWATVIAQAFSAFLIMRLLFKPDAPYRLTKDSLKINKILLKSMLKIGLPTSLQASMYGISNMIITVGINSLGTVVVASWAMSGKIDGVYWAISEAFGIALMNFVAQNYGAGKADRIKQGAKSGALVFMAITILISGILLLVSRPLLTIFTTDVQVQETTWQIITYFVPIYITWTLIEIFSGILRGIGDTLIPAVIMAIGVCAVRIIWVFTVFQMYPTLLIISLSYPISWVITDIALGIYYAKRRKRLYMPIEPPEHT